VIRRRGGAAGLRSARRNWVPMPNGARTLLIERVTGPFGGPRPSGNVLPMLPLATTESLPRQLVSRGVQITAGRGRLRVLNASR